MKPISLFHFQLVLQKAKQFLSLKRSHHYGIFMGCLHGTGRAQRWHLAVTCNVTVTIVKTIVMWRICLIRSHKINPRDLKYKRMVKTTQIAYSASLWTQFSVSRDLFTDLTARDGTVRTFLLPYLTAASRIQNCTYQKSQSNLPNGPQQNVTIKTTSMWYMF